jgi:hypothetical protein
MGILICLLLKRSLHVGTWLQKLEIPPHGSNLPDMNGGISPTLPVVMLESRHDLIYFKENLTSLGRL